MVSPHNMTNGYIGVEFPNSVWPVEVLSAVKSVSVCSGFWFEYTPGTHRTISQIWVEDRCRVTGMLNEIDGPLQDFGGWA